jgi:HK97 family phage major capsid protein
MSARTVIVPMWSADPVPAFRAENGAVAQTDGNVVQVTLAAKSLAGYTTISRELISDTNIESVLENAYAAAVAQAWDTAALLGNGTAPNPTGIFNQTGITDKSALGTNGVAFTYDHLIDAVGAVRGRNEVVTGAIMAPRSAQSLGKLKDTQGRYIDRPSYLADVPMLQTGNIPVNQVQGTANNASSLAVADFRQLLIGVREAFSVDVYEQPAATNLQVLLVAHMRMDVAIGRGSAFALRTGLLP